MSKKTLARWVVEVSQVLTVLEEADVVLVAKVVLDQVVVEVLGLV